MVLSLSPCVSPLFSGLPVCWFSCEEIIGETQGEMFMVMCDIKTINNHVPIFKGSLYEDV